MDSKVKEIFWDTKIRILEFSIVNEPRLDEKKEDLIKKEIFRRYNSGITPLKNPEIENAVYIDNELTIYFKKNLRKDKEFYEKILHLFFTSIDLDNIDKKNTLDKVMLKIRQLLVLHNIPIKKYSTLAGRANYLTDFYNILSRDFDTEIEVALFYNKFKAKINILTALEKKLIEKKSYLARNNLVFECTFWMLTILENEIDKISIFDDVLLSDYAEYLIKNEDKFTRGESVFYKQVNERYNLVAKYFENKLNIKCNVYLDDYTVFKKVTAENKSESDRIEEIKNDIEKLEHLRLNKPEPSSLTIEDICRQMNKDKFLIRPPYQREEVINQVKSSALIESIILGIKLPPIFIYKTLSGMNEVVDGQQRILSILGFIGQEFTDENGNRVKSRKNYFALEKLNILSDLNGKSYKDLDPKTQGKILDFNLDVVYIDEKLNPKFNKIDLFIRLNNKPYPIKDHSFEMWNSYINKDVINTIKENMKKHSSWFYLKISDKDTRMENEELYTTLAYLEYKQGNEEGITSTRNLSIFSKDKKLYIRLKEKPDITRVLNSVTTKESEKNIFMNSIKNVESLIKKLKLILLDQDIANDSLEEFLKFELNKLFSPHTLNPRRTTQSFYTLWIILDDVKLEMVKMYRKEIKKEITDIFLNLKNAEDNPDVVKSFWKNVGSFKEKYKTNNRRIKLSEEEKRKLINKQKNVCPLCNNTIFYGDDVEVDHLIPISVGGRDSFLNLQVVHKSCNREKKANLVF